MTLTQCLSWRSLVAVEKHALFPGEQCPPWQIVSAGRTFCESMFSLQILATVALKVMFKTKSFSIFLSKFNLLSIKQIQLFALRIILYCHNFHLLPKRFFPLHFGLCNCMKDLNGWFLSSLWFPMSWDISYICLITLANVKLPDNMFVFGSPKVHMIECLYEETSVMKNVR